jgi:hypothetical protein
VIDAREIGLIKEGMSRGVELRDQGGEYERNGGARPAHDQAYDSAPTAQRQEDGEHPNNKRLGGYSGAKEPSSARPTSVEGKNQSVDC